jgi:hypothetical protein
VVEEKPEVRKVGGVFYTPTFIVSAIVRETLGRLVVSAELPTFPQSWQLCRPGGRTPVRVAAEQTPNVKTMLQRQIDATDRHAEGGRSGV